MKRRLIISGIAIFLSIVLIYGLLRFGVPYVGGLGGGELSQIEQNVLSGLFIPSIWISIVLTLIGVSTVYLLILKIKKEGLKKTFLLKNYILVVVMTLVLYFITRAITLFPYGNLIVGIITFLSQILIYGILIPYIFTSQITYLILLFKNDIKEILK